MTLNVTPGSIDSESDADSIDGETDADSLVQRIVEGTVDATGRGPLDLPPIYDAIDPDALAALYRRNGDDGPRVEFFYAGCDVTVRGDGSVSVIPEPIDANGSAAAEDSSLSQDC